MYTKFTRNGRQKIAKAHAGDITLPKITHMAFGTGGHITGDVTKPIEPSESAEALENEILRKAISSHSYPDFNLATYVCTIASNESNGQIITEAALIDAEGTIVAIKTFGGKTKDSDVEMPFEWTSRY